LRNDGSWKEKRLFSGPLAYDTASGNFQLRLTSPAPEEPDASLAGPFFDNNIPFGLSRDSDGDSVLTLTIEGGALTWESDVAKLRLEPVREDARAGLVAEAQADGAKLLEATKVGAIYTGTITNKAKGTKGNWLLRFTKQEETTGDDKSGATLTAVLEHMEHTAWKCVLQGPLVTNRYRANGVPVHLDQQPSDHTPPKEVTDIFENRRDSNEESDSAMWLRFDGGRLVGENARFVFRFEPATGEFLAEREKKQAASSKP
jgi:hypothetical protein